MFEGKNFDDALELAEAGGGFEIDLDICTYDMAFKIALAAGRSGAQITFTGAKNEEIDNLSRIARAGKGNIKFAN